MSTETTELLAHLREHYANTPAPKPSPALVVRMDAGTAGVAAVITETPADELAARRWGQDVAPSFLERARARTRYVAAGVAAAFVVTGGLAAAGVLPHPLQRHVSSIASDLGIDLPSPVDASTSDQGPGRPSSTRKPSSADSASTTGDTPTAPSAVPPITEPPITEPPITEPVGQGVEAAPPTVPSPVALGTGPLSDDFPPIALPPVTTPDIDLPLEGVNPLPAIELPPITVPQLPINLDWLLPGSR